MGFELRQGHEVPEAMRLREGDGALQCRRFENHIAVGEQKPRSPRPLRTLVRRVVLAQPAFGKRLDVEHGEPGVAGGECLQQGARPVFRSIVHRDDLQVWVILSEQGEKRRLDPRGFVPAGNNHTHHRPGGQHRPVHLAQCGEACPEPGKPHQQGQVEENQQA